jgi:thiosulfate reductase cytochrome b subunit
MLPAPRRVLIKRHSVTTRLTHWTNALAILVLAMSGMQIFNAHPALYWGDVSTFARPWLAMVAGERGGEPVGVLKIGGKMVETTGVLGWSGGQSRGFPAWATLPSYQSLADGRRWHFFFAWIFAINGLIYLAVSLIGGHLKRDLLPGRDQLRSRALLHDIGQHLRLRFPRGQEARRYNVLQKGAYLAVIFGLLPLMLLTGLCMAPAVGAGAPWLVEAFGGRQSARTIHFLSASGVVLFVLVHLVMVLVSGPLNQVRAMITGRYAIEEDAT